MHHLYIYPQIVLHKYTAQDHRTSNSTWSKSNSTWNKSNSTVGCCGYIAALRGCQRGFHPPLRLSTELLQLVLSHSCSSAQWDEKSITM